MAVLLILLLNWLYVSYSQPDDLASSINNFDRFDFLRDVLIVPPDIPSSCPRERRAWHLLSDSERQQYIDGYLQLSALGVLEVFREQHERIWFTSPPQAHSSSGFGPWHRYYIWEFESQMRRLGGNYSCFSLPYWYISVFHS